LVRVLHEYSVIPYNKYPRVFQRRRRALRLVLQKMTACVMVSVSYRSQSVSNFHSSRSTATKNCLMPWRARAAPRE